MSIATATAPKTSAASRKTAADTEHREPTSPAVRRIPTQPRPLLRQSMTIQAPGDEDSCVTVEMIVVARDETDADFYASSRSLIPEIASFAALRQAGWQGYSCGDLTVYTRIIPGA
jgi:hypothetical protein